VLLIAPPEVAEYFGEKIPWEVSHTDLAILTGGKTDCWTRFVHDSHTPRYIDARGEEPAQMRNHISMSLGIRPVITVKRK
jgi:hypothetical protein